MTQPSDELQDEEPTVYYQNPFYHSLFGFSRVAVPSKRLRFQIDHKAEVITITQPQSGRQFEEQVRGALIREVGWPLKGPLLLAISMTLPSESFQSKDVDNIAKAVLDALKGICVRRRPTSRLAVRVEGPGAGRLVLRRCSKP